MKLKGFFIGYALLSFVTATSSGLLWRPFRPRTDDPQCGSAYCPTGNQMACLVHLSGVRTECISQWRPCYFHWLRSCSGSRSRMHCELTRRGCKCVC
uniref:Putative secreted peptide n=1 Tax=Rhipicephalus pulchellus TaxID=72859 RepID=L7MAG3_RHIPC